MGPEIGAVHTGYWRVLVETGQVLESGPRKEGELWPELLNGNCVHPSSMLLKAHCFERLGNFDERITTGLDYDMWIRVSREYKFAAIGQPLVKVREHANRLSTNFELQIRGQNRFFEKWGQWIEADEKNYCRYFVQLGILYSLTGKKEEGRKAYWKALRRYPLQMKPYWLLALSCFGTQVFRGVANANEAVSLWIAGLRCVGNNHQIN